MNNTINKMSNSSSNEITSECKPNRILNLSCFEGLFNEMMVKVKHSLAIWKAAHQILIKRILLARHTSSTVIIKFFKTFKLMKEIRHETLVNGIINQRQSAAQLVQSNYKRHLNSKQFRSLYSKVKNCYSIYPSISTSHPFIMRVFLRNQYKQVKVKYCSLRKAFVIDIPKAKVLNTRQLKFNYLINNQVIIDPTLCTQYDNGHYVNVLDFGAMEKKQRQSVIECIETYSKRKLSNNESSTTTNADELHFDNDGENENEEAYCRNCFKGVTNEAEEKERRLNGMKTVQVEGSQMQMSLEKHKRSNRKFLTVKTDMSMVKSILKPCMSTSSNGRNVNLKKVCFGRVQFSF